MKLLIDLLAFIQPYGAWSYFIIFGVLIACGFGLPIPEDVTLVTAGILAARGIIDFKLAVLLCMGGVLLGDGIVFTLGRTMGQKLRGSRIGRVILSPKRDDAVKSLIARYGDKIIFMARFMPGFRTPLFFATGSYHVPFWKFLALDGLAALVSAPLWVYVGFLFGANLEELEKVIRRFQYGIYGVLGGLIILFIAGILLKRRIARSANTVSTGDAENLE